MSKTTAVTALKRLVIMGAALSITMGGVTSAHASSELDKGAKRARELTNPMSMYEVTTGDPWNAKSCSLGFAGTWKGNENSVAFLTAGHCTTEDDLNNGTKYYVGPYHSYLQASVKARKWDGGLGKKDYAVIEGEKKQDGAGKFSFGPSNAMTIDTKYSEYKKGVMKITGIEDPKPGMVVCAPLQTNETVKYTDNRQITCGKIPETDNKTKSGEKWIAETARIRGGDSGAPVITPEGKAVGIISEQKDQRTKFVFTAIKDILEEQPDFKLAVG
ncbi:hypothetical protein KEM60_01061 [Austwickia sp. TVS 96-490-7B]|uniref:trypsin-like peptidase domain-containing protein n=1 Tax=Austwickia sp. TVS 96-490-7B TaxID=2830843 RepID=UPI001C58B118|nr:trypsin-like peptidase domain-containing protein [Austwickia sp. TVS 96-490-7B]MBW3084872.1 hypothetical protein [Austwickia sp. TVS 96-490-7B]